jgi:hypothetical protein
MIPTVPFCMQVPYEEQRVICNGKPLMLDSRKTMKQVNVSVFFALHAYLVSNPTDITCTQIDYRTVPVMRFEKTLSLL